MNTQYNAGLAPIVIVLILVGVVVVGGGTYLAVRSGSDVKVAEQTSSPSVSSTVSSTPTNTATPTATKTATPVPTKKPAVAVSVKFATVQEAVTSGKTVACVGAWYSEKGPDEYRTRYTIKGASVTIVREKKVAGTISVSSTTTYTASSPNYSTILASSLSTASCTQQ